MMDPGTKSEVFPPLPPIAGAFGPLKCLLGRIRLLGLYQAPPISTTFNEHFRVFQSRCGETFKHK